MGVCSDERGDDDGGSEEGCLPSSSGCRPQPGRGPWVPLSWGCPFPGRSSWGPRAPTLFQDVTWRGDTLAQGPSPGPNSWTRAPLGARLSHTGCRPDNPAGHPGRGTLGSGQRRRRGPPSSKGSKTVRAGGGRVMSARSPEPVWEVPGWGRGWVQPVLWPRPGGLQPSGPLTPGTLADMGSAC